MSDLSFSFVDLLVVAIILVSAIYAMYRGFVSETLSIFAWAAAAFATLYFGPALAHFLHGRINPAWLGNVFGYGVVFLLVFIPLSFISYRISQGVRESPVGTLDRVFGLAFGVVRGLAIIGLIYFVFSSFVKVKDQPDWVTQARTLPLIQSSTEVLLSLVPSRDRLLPMQVKQAGNGAKPDNMAAASPAQKPQPVATRTHKRKTYGARERHALDNLIEATGSGEDKNP